MTPNPPPPPPLPQAASKRPRALPVFGILFIVFGAIGILSGLKSLPLYLGSLEKSTDPLATVFLKDPALFHLMKWVSLVGSVFCVVELISGIGLIKSKEWGRQAALLLSLYMIVSGLVVGYLTTTRLMPAIIESSIARTPGGAEAAPFIRIVSMLAGGVGIVFGLALPITALVLLTRPRIKAWCRGETVLPTGTPPPPSS